MNNSDDIEKINKLVREAFGGNVFRQFKPFAVFNNPMDSILIMTKDRSFTEIKINQALAILEDNYPKKEENKYIGFKIWGIRHFCTTYKVQYSGKTSLKELFEAIIAKYPCPMEYQEEILRMINEVNYVELPS